MRKIWSFFKDTLLNFFLNLTSWMPDNPIVCRFRGLIVRLFIKSGGKRLEVGARIKVLHCDGIEIGSDVYIAGGCWISGRGGLKIENEVIFGPYVIVVTSNHTFVNGSARFGKATYAPTKIGSGSWLASHVVVAAGVEIGKGNLVAANAVVTKSTPDNVTVGGIPGKIIGEVK